ncbi:MAG: N-acetylmuramoyl-L-alanine amidase [Prevotella sp.]|nr:N-acetylmuramoyl-L-alanine amidase [Prevotella sp.]MDY4038456.1 N-acetylmuramoyl-L-alanine amidase [Prevotella sp.]
MKKRFLSLMLLMALMAVTAIAAPRRFTLVIDPGHGGHDTGALGAISKEKDINLNVALAFGSYVERNNPDVRVIYTRKTDVFIPLQERANIANRNKADLFISIHTNALPNGKIARGFETYTLGMHRAADNLDVAKRENAVILIEKDYKQRYQGFDPNSSESYIMFEFIQGRNMEKSVDLAKMIQGNVCSVANRPDKGVHQAGFLVLRETSMPSCLIELGFITTADEEQSLNNSTTVDNIARGIYLAFNNYKKKYDEGIVVPFKAEKNEAPEIPAIVQKDYQPQEVKPEQVKTQPERPAVRTQPEQPKAPALPAADQAKPVFKVQILASSRLLKAGDSQLNGVTDFEVYQEGGLYKYTLGASNNYNDIYKLRKSVSEKFPEAFIIAFKNGEKMNVNQAIREFKAGK